MPIGTTTIYFTISCYYIYYNQQLNQEKQKEESWLDAITQIYQSSHCNRVLYGRLTVVKVNCKLPNLDLEPAVSWLVFKRLNTLGDPEMLVTFNLWLILPVLGCDWIQSRFRFTKYTSQDQFNCSFVVLLRFFMIWLQSSYVHVVTTMLSSMVTVPISCTFWIKYGPDCGSANLGRISGLLRSKTRSLPYIQYLSFEFSLQFDLPILFCFFRVISAQSALYCIGKIMSLPKTSWDGEAPKVVCSVLLIVDAVAAKNISHWCDLHLPSQTFLGNFYSTWCMCSSIALACGSQAPVVRCLIPKFSHSCLNYNLNSLPPSEPTTIHCGLGYLSQKCGCIHTCLGLLLWVLLQNNNWLNPSLSFAAFSVYYPSCCSW